MERTAAGGSQTAGNENIRTSFPRLRAALHNFTPLLRRQNNITDEVPYGPLTTGTIERMTRFVEASGTVKDEIAGSLLIGGFGGGGFGCVAGVLGALAYMAANNLVSLSTSAMESALALGSAFGTAIVTGWFILSENMIGTYLDIKKEGRALNVMLGAGWQERYSALINEQMAIKEAGNEREGELANYVANIRAEEDRRATKAQLWLDVYSKHMGCVDDPMTGRARGETYGSKSIWNMP